MNRDEEQELRRRRPLLNPFNTPYRVTPVGEEPFILHDVFSFWSIRLP